jgi:hypothetical protein
MSEKLKITIVGILIFGLQLMSRESINGKENRISTLDIRDLHLRGVNIYG